MAKCEHPDCEVALGLTATDLGPFCGLHLEHAKDIIRGEQRLIDAEQRIAELEAKLAALDWTPITESNLPKVGDETLSESHRVILVNKVTAAWDSKTFIDHKRFYRRPINPPVQP